MTGWWRHRQTGQVRGPGFDSKARVILPYCHLHYSWRLTWCHTRCPNRCMCSIPFLISYDVNSYMTLKICVQSIFKYCVFNGVWPDHFWIHPLKWSFWYQMKAIIFLITPVKYYLQQMLFVKVINKKLKT